MSGAAVPVPARPEPDPHRDPIARALVEVVLAGDPALRTPAEISRRAGLARSEFDRRYAGFDECLLDTYERFIDDFEHKVGTAYNSRPEWRSALRGAAYATAEWMETSPELVDFGTVEVLRTENEMVRVRREDLARFCAALIERGREAPDALSEIPEGASLMAIGSILNLVSRRVHEGADVEPRAMVPEMMYLVVRIYLGEDIAREELSPPPEERGGPPDGS